jgi:hypothetical protein
MTTSTLQTPQTITVAAPPSTTEVVAQMLSMMASLTGVATDYNTGSQIRTSATSVGSVIEQQGIWAQAQAYQALIYSALSLFNLQPGVPVAASGAVAFSTSPSGSVPASQNVTIPAGTLVQTAGGIQFATVSTVTLVAGASSINVNVAAVVPGIAGNVAANTIITIISGLSYPLFVNNASGAGGGSNAISAAQSFALFAAIIASIGLSSPVAIANAAVGVSVGSETVAYSTLYEPFAAAGSGAGSGVAGWVLYIDNGTGTASTNLINAVVATLNGGSVSGQANASGAIGYRDAGVPYAVSAVVPTVAVVGVSASLASGANATLVSGAIASAVSGYFTLPFGEAAQQAQIAASVANAIAGSITSLTVSLYVSGSSTAVTGVAPGAIGRVILGALTQSVS